VRRFLWEHSLNQRHDPGRRGFLEAFRGEYSVGVRRKRFKEGRLGTASNVRVGKYLGWQRTSPRFFRNPSHLPHGLIASLKTTSKEWRASSWVSPVAWRYEWSLSDCLQLQFPQPFCDSSSEAQVAVQATGFCHSISRKARMNIRQRSIRGHRQSNLKMQCAGNLTRKYCCETDV